MSTHVLHTAIAARFVCLGDKCEDTCCQNWSMQVDPATLSRYKASAPELIAATEEEPDGLVVMKRDPESRYCVKLEGGWCGIHKQYGDAMLGDACHFYPRVTRALGPEIHMTASPSCPEVVRMLLRMEAPFETVDARVPRLPSQLREYVPQDMQPQIAANVHNAFLSAALDDSVPPERSLARISSVARSMLLLDPATLDQSVSLYLRLADGRLPQPEPHPADSFNLLHMLCGLIVASRKPISPRLQHTIADMESALKATLDWQHITIHLAPDSADAAHAVQALWLDAPPAYTHALRRMLAMQMSLHFFPLAGLGDNYAERITFIGVRFALTKLAIACAHLQHGDLDEEQLVRIIQSLARFMDHLGDASFSRTIFQETGWLSESRLLALLS